MSAPEISVVIPARNEAQNLATLLPEVRDRLSAHRHEIIVVDDGSSDHTGALLQGLAGDDPSIRYVRHAVSLGKSAALWSGVRQAAAEIIVTIDGDGQNDPRFIRDLVAPLADPLVGVVAGQRTHRKDSLPKKIVSPIANRVRGALLGDHTRDTACGAKAFRREAYLVLPYFETMHRFLPALFLGDGWRVAHVDVVDRPRQHGRSHYGILDRLAVGIPDLFGVLWLTRRRRKSPFRRGDGGVATRDAKK